MLKKEILTDFPKSGFSFLRITNHTFTAFPVCREEGFVGILLIDFFEKPTGHTKSSQAYRMDRIGGHCIKN